MHSIDIDRPSILCAMTVLILTICSGLCSEAADLVPNAWVRLESATITGERPGASTSNHARMMSCRSIAMPEPG
jgi:hypothetical protein